MNEETAKRPLPLPKWTGLAIAAIAIVVAIVIALRFGIGASLILLAGGALVLFIWLAFRAVQSMTEPDETLSLEVGPTPAQTRKAAALRAIKDLDYEKSVGNLSEDDYRELHTRYREEAKRAMREVDDERAALRERAEAIAERAIERELGDEAAVATVEKREDPTPTPAEAPVSRRAREQTRPECPECATKNEPDAKFCKQCGGKMNSAEAST
jgi:hypothetical protein